MTPRETIMIVGVPKEIKTDEYRVAMTPAGVEELTQARHRVLIQSGAGSGSGISDDQYTENGAEILAAAADIWAAADLIVKVKEPLPEEWPLMRRGQIVFTYFHFAADERLTRAVMASGVTAIAYETIRDSRGQLPLLTPMSEVAGRMSIQEGAKYLERPFQGRGILLGGVPGVAPAIPGARAPHLVTRADLKRLTPRSVIIDVAIDQGGCVETAHATTHSDPIYIVDDIVHYCVANMPGAVGRTSTYALCNVTLPYALQIANKGDDRALAENSALREGVNIRQGRVVNAAVAETFGLELAKM